MSILIKRYKWKLFYAYLSLNPFILSYFKNITKNNRYKIRGYCKRFSHTLIKSPSWLINDTPTLMTLPYPPLAMEERIDRYVITILATFIDDKNTLSQYPRILYPLGWISKLFFREMKRFKKAKYLRFAMY